MCSLAHIRCEVVSGYAKGSVSSIGKLSRKNRHSWNIVLLKDKWYPADPTWAAGTTDKKVRHFKKDYTDAWFLTKRDLFALSHYPDNKKWHLEDSPVIKPVFTMAPIIRLLPLCTR